MNDKKLKQLLDEEFNPSSTDCDAVVRQIIKLEQSSKLGEVYDDDDDEITEERIVNAFKQADRDLTTSWNWWIGELDYSYGGFVRFQL